MTSLLEMRGITKSFPGVKALDGVDFTLSSGEVHSLMGENGAGKSTLIKVLTGVYSRESGSVTMQGNSIDPRSTLDAQHHGISTVYQEVNLIPELSVAENICLGRQPRRFGALNWKSINNRGRKALERLDLELDVTQPLRSYSIAIQQMVAIARAMDCDAKVLILDEPTSSLDKNEVKQLFELMRKLKNEGIGIVFVSHFLDQVYEISDRITVLRNGKLVGSYEAQKLPRLELVARMIGKSVEEVQAREKKERTALEELGETVLEASQLGRRNMVEPTDLVIRKGEIVGLAGLLGSGRTELAELIFGIHRAETGKVKIEGTELKKSRPLRSMARGMALLPEDRKSQGILPSLSIRENIALSLQARRGWWRPIPRKQQNQMSEKYIRALNIATPDAEKPIGQLSGGNQQKVILARWLASEPRLLILDEPTRGIDVGAKGEIEDLMRELCSKGMAILFISGELDEVVRDSTRVIVLRDRHKVGELKGEEITMSNVMDLIAGSEDAPSH